MGPSKRLPIQARLAFFVAESSLVDPSQPGHARPVRGCLPPGGHRRIKMGVDTMNEVPATSQALAWWRVGSGCSGRAFSRGAT